METSQVKNILGDYDKEIAKWKKTLPDRLRFLKNDEIKVRDAVLVKDSAEFRSIHIDGEIFVEDGLVFYFSAVINCSVEKRDT